MRGSGGMGSSMASAESFCPREMCTLVSFIMENEPDAASTIGITETTTTENGTGT